MSNHFHFGMACAEVPKPPRGFVTNLPANLRAFPVYVPSTMPSIVPTCMFLRGARFHHHKLWVVA
jgi:hypothetical protein